MKHRGRIWAIACSLILAMSLFMGGYEYVEAGCTWVLGAGDIIDFTAVGKLNQGAGSGLDADMLDGKESAVFELTANKNAASGYAGLDASSKLTGSQQVYGTAANTACEGNDPRLTNLASVQVFTSSGTWTKPTNVKKVLVEVVGGGGGGGGSLGGSSPNESAGGGGGGGGGAKKFIDVSAISSETITVGAAGAAGAPGNNNGGSGGTSSFGAHCSATGGGGGIGDSSSNGAQIGGLGGSSGVGSSGNVNIQGQPGGWGWLNTNATPSVSGNGGSSYIGGGGRSIGAQSFGSAGGNYGGGGSGGACAGTSQAGGAGAAGVVIVWEYK